MKKIIFAIALMLSSASAFAGPGSVLGGRPLEDSPAHYVALGWPSVAYEWWHAGKPDRAIGGELVYGDWSGNFSDVDIGFALNVPLRWHLSHSDQVDVAFRLTPGALIGENTTPGPDQFILGLRGDFGIPVTIDVNDRINIITGGTVPFTVLFVENGAEAVVIPLLARIGVEFKATERVNPFFMLEVGPTIGHANSNTEVELGLRAWVGSVFF